MFYHNHSQWTRKWYCVNLEVRNDISKVQCSWKMKIVIVKGYQWSWWCPCITWTIHVRSVDRVDINLQIKSSLIYLFNLWPSNINNWFFISMFYNQVKNSCNTPTLMYQLWRMKGYGLTTLLESTLHWKGGISLLRKFWPKSVKKAHFCQKVTLLVLFCQFFQN